VTSFFRNGVTLQRYPFANAVSHAGKALFPGLTVLPARLMT
jgi:hypothetical protein